MRWVSRYAQTAAYDFAIGVPEINHAQYFTMTRHERAPRTRDPRGIIRVKRATV
jgi:hypothetical protein